ncbi:MULTISPECIES: hypothetical protein [unclassified Bradyrhizobium]|uniref:hypothetical protein n=1 Tax=unclassified Bradyrhizobium TaxID=2631580 RepID=UPI002119B38A|nr:MULTISPECIES: hypothetical protein [unclassified Bradyrhizobium]
MHMPSIITGCLAVLACAVLAAQMTRLRRNSHAIFNGGILLFIGLLIASAMPILSRLPWAEFADETADQAIAALHLLEITYVILTL